MRPFPFLLSLLLALVAWPSVSRAADQASVHAILITASKEKAPADRRLAPYEATLQRNLPESSFRFVAEGTASVAGSGTRASISLGSGHAVQLQGGSRDGDGISIKVRWMSGRNVVMNNSFTFQPGVPIVLGQRSNDDADVPIVILIAK
jgi:hypothetical protein